MMSFLPNRDNNVYPQKLTVDKQARTKLLGQKPAVLWFTGLSGAGKSTIADLVEQSLHVEGYLTYIIDGDNFRCGLSRDLGFAAADRVENMRRAGEVAKFFVDSGVIVLCSFVSPFIAEREMIRKQFEAEEFIEIFVDAPIETCIARDPKGLYAKSGNEAIKNLTGVSSPYEPPPRPELRLRSDHASARDLADNVVRFFRARQRQG